MLQAIAQSGEEVIGQLKVSHGGYPKDYLNEHLKDAPGGVHIVMKGTLPSGVEAVAIGYKYSSKRVLFFLSTPGAGLTMPGEQYEMRYSNIRMSKYSSIMTVYFYFTFYCSLTLFSYRYGNVKARYVPRPELISRFYRHSNCIDMSNQLREDGLRLEKQWVTRDGYFRMCTGVVGMTLVDVFKLGQFHGILPRGTHDLSIRMFAGIVSEQLSLLGRFLSLRARIHCQQEIGQKQLDLQRQLIQVEQDEDDTDDDITAGESDRKRKSSYGYSERNAKRVRSPSIDMVFDGADAEITDDRIVYRFHDSLGNDHWVAQFPKTVGSSGKRYTMARKCSKCMKHTCCYCLQCNIPLCYCISGGGSGNGGKHERDCFKQHIRDHARRSQRLDKEHTVSELIN